MTADTSATTMPSAPIDLEFAPPGPGSWQRDATHYPRPATRFHTEIFPEHMSKGFREFCRRYGLLIDTLDYSFVHGFAYFAVRPAPDAEVPARFSTAAEVFERKLWREDMRRWEQGAKPRSIRVHRELLAVEPTELTIDELLSYLDRCRENLCAMFVQHHRFNGAALLPLTDFLAQAGDWTGLAEQELLVPLKGSAPASAGVSDELDTLATAIRADSRSQALLASGGDPGELLGQLRGLPGAGGTAARAYLELVGYRVVDGFEVGDPVALETPELVVTGIRAAVEGPAGIDGEEVEERTAMVRDLVPAGERGRFDELLAEARATYGLRDERGLFSEIWASGVTRRAILAAGARLAGRGRIEKEIDLVEASYDELCSLLQTGEGPRAEELAARRAYRSRFRSIETPPWLGSPPEPPPPLEGLPPAAARAMRAIGLGIGAIFGDTSRKSEARLVRGLAGSPGAYEGTARNVSGPGEFGRIHQGDVLVTHATSEAFNIVLPRLGAIVTDSGGILSHAAIVAREYGVPAVVGTGDATTIIPEGARVRVDGARGEVALVS